nr:prenyltransferase/squalene oxidase repeat-containing protein [Bremerella cremea]
MIISRRLFVGLTPCLLLTFGSLGIAAESPISNESQKKLDQIVSKGLKYLETKGQAEDGSFTAQAGPGLTALALTSALRNGKTVDDPVVAKGLKALEGFVKPDGGIYGNGRLRNYETCVAMLCFEEANNDGRYNDLLKKARAFVTGLQYGDGNMKQGDVWFGGVGYSGAGRPDLSNTAYLVEALFDTGSEADNEAIQNALVFISRCQNLSSKYNTTQFADKVNDGGFFYEIPREKIDPSTSPDRYTENGGIRSYGSMTYAGLKSMIYAGLTKDDPRVKAATQWVTENYSVDTNPGMGNAGLYYYYHTFAAGLGTAGIDELTDAAGNKHNWREDLINELAKRQHEDGSWANENGRWFENDKNLATAFALMALSYCDADTKPTQTQPAK